MESRPSVLPTTLLRRIWLKSERLLADAQERCFGLINAAPVADCTANIGMLKLEMALVVLF